MKEAYVIAQLRVSDGEPYGRYAAVRSDSAAWYGASVVGRGSLILLEGLE